MQNHKFKVSKDYDRIIVDITEDEKLIRESNFNWDELLQLKQELSDRIMDFVGQVSNCALNPNFTTRLGNRTEEFQKVVVLFFEDVKNFSVDVAAVNKEHEGKSGPVTTMADYDLYNRVSINYHALFNNLTTLVTPTLSELMFIINDTMPVQVPLNSDEITASEENITEEISDQPKAE